MTTLINCPDCGGAIPAGTIHGCPYRGPVRAPVPMSGTETRCEYCGGTGFIEDGFCDYCGGNGARPAPPEPRTEDADEALACIQGYGWAHTVLAAELARLRALASSSSAIREAAEQVVAYWLVWYEDAENDAAEFHLRAAIASLRAALSSSGASPTDTNGQQEQNQG